jgi:hypothetical protein
MFDGTEFAPAGETKFHKGEPLISFFEIYGPRLKNTSAALRLEMRVADVKTERSNWTQALSP